MTRTERNTRLAVLFTIIAGIFIGLGITLVVVGVIGCSGNAARDLRTANTYRCLDCEHASQVDASTETD